MYRFTSKQYTDKLLRYRLETKDKKTYKEQDTVCLVLCLSSCFWLACLLRARAHAKNKKTNKEQDTQSSQMIVANNR